MSWHEAEEDQDQQLLLIRTLRKVSGEKFFHSAPALATGFSERRIEPFKIQSDPCTVYPIDPLPECVHLV